MKFKVLVTKEELDKEPRSLQRQLNAIIKARIWFLWVF